MPAIAEHTAKMAEPPAAVRTDTPERPELDTAVLERGRERDNKRTRPLWGRPDSKFPDSCRAEMAPAAERSLEPADTLTAVRAERFEKPGHLHIPPTEPDKPTAPWTERRPPSKAASKTSAQGQNQAPAQSPELVENIPRRPARRARF